MKLKSVTVLFCNSNPRSTIWKSNNVQQILDDDVAFLAKQKVWRFVFNWVDFEIFIVSLHYIAQECKHTLNDRITGNLRLLDNTKDFIIEVNVCHGRNPEETLPTDVKV